MPGRRGRSRGEGQHGHTQPLAPSGSHRLVQPLRRVPDGPPLRHSRPVSASERPKLPEDLLEVLNHTRGGFNALLGLHYTRANYDEVVAECKIGPHLHQPYGLVHGGVYASIIEAVASTAAAIHAMHESRTAVGLENTTSFLRATREGTLVARAHPLTRGRRSHVWEVGIRDEHDRLLACGRVRVLCLEAGTAVAGETLQARHDPAPPTKD